MGVICRTDEIKDLIYEFISGIPSPDEIELIENEEKKIICEFLYEFCYFLTRLPIEIDDYHNLAKASHIVSTVLCLGREIEKIINLYFPDLVPIFGQIYRAMRELRRELIPYIPILD